jgi:glycosyltransferase involved in cell wall biosynthesis
MTSYNHEQYIRAAIESVLVSTFADFELIIVDDCSLDKPPALAHQYARTDRRLHVVTHDTNLGDYPNRNRAASYATGTYLKYLDADDLLYPHSLATFVASMESHADAALGLSSYVVQHSSPFPLPFPPGTAFHYHFFVQGFLDCGPSGTIIRREAFEVQGGFSGKRMVGDTELWMKIAAALPSLSCHLGCFSGGSMRGRSRLPGSRWACFWRRCCR